MSVPVQASLVPAELKAFAEPSCLLPGESRHEFEIIRRMIIDDLQPRTNLEWLWVLDVTEQSWEILRYRRLKEKILQINRASAVASLLERLDGAGSADSAAVAAHSRRSAEQWAEDPDAAEEIEARLERNGFDVFAINAEVFLQIRVPFSLLDGLMQSAQHRRIILLREFGARREFESRVDRIANYAKRSGRIGTRRGVIQKQVT